MVLPMVGRQSYAVENPFTQGSNPFADEVVSEMTEETSCGTAHPTPNLEPHRAPRRGTGARSGSKVGALETITPMKRVSVVSNVDTQRRARRSNAGSRKSLPLSQSTLDAKDEEEWGGMGGRRDSLLSQATTAGSGYNATLQRKGSRVAQVMQRLQSMSAEERQDLESRYREYKREDTERQKEIREKNEADIHDIKMHQRGAKRARSDAPLHPGASRGEVVRQQRRKSLELNAIHREEAARAREAERDPAVRRQRRLLVAFAHAAFGNAVAHMFGAQKEADRKRAYFCGARESVWMALACAKLKAAARRNLFLKYCIFKHRFRRYRRGAAVIRVFLEHNHAIAQRTRSVWTVISAAKRVARFWRTHRRVLEAQAELFRRHWERLGKTVLAGDGAVCTQHIPDDVRRVCIRGAVRRRRAAFVVTVADVREAMAKDIDDFESPQRKCMVGGIKLPRMKHMLSDREMAELIKESYAFHIDLKAARRAFTAREEPARAELVDLEARLRAQLAVRFTGIAVAIDTPDEEPQLDPTYADEALPSEAGSGDASAPMVWDPLTGRRVKGTPDTHAAVPPAGPRNPSPRSLSNASQSSRRRSSLLSQQQQRRSLTERDPNARAATATPTQPASLPPVKAGRRVFDGNSPSNGSVKPSAGRRRSTRTSVASAA